MSSLPGANVYNRVMARGWESKSIESQIESASENSSNSASHKQLSSQEQRRRRKREQLLLSQKYVRQQMDAASSERYRESLRNALAEIEQQLAALHPEV
jgi:hypothetical protein